MKQYFILLFALFFLGCTKKNNQQSETQYYVKYVIDGKSSIQQMNNTGLKVTLNNEKSVMVDYIRSNRGANEFVVGPVKKGFVSSLSGTNVCCVSCCYISPNLQIFVSENNGPFVLKKEDLSTQLRDAAQISYTIE